MKPRGNVKPQIATHERAPANSSRWARAVPLLIKWCNQDRAGRVTLMLMLLDALECFPQTSVRELSVGPAVSEVTLPFQSKEGNMKLTGRLIHRGVVDAGCDQGSDFQQCPSKAKAGPRKDPNGLLVTFSKRKARARFPGRAIYRVECNVGDRGVTSSRVAQPAQDLAGQGLSAHFRWFDPQLPQLEVSGSCHSFTRACSCS